MMIRYRRMEWLVLNVMGFYEWKYKVWFGDGVLVYCYLWRMWGMGGVGYVGRWLVG